MSDGWLSPLAVGLITGQAFLVAILFALGLWVSWNRWRLSIVNSVFERLFPQFQMGRPTLPAVEYARNTAVVVPQERPIALPDDRQLTPVAPPRRARAERALEYVELVNRVTRIEDAILQVSIDRHFARRSRSQSTVHVGGEQNPNPNPGGNPGAGDNDIPPGEGDVP